MNNLPYLLRISSITLIGFILISLVGFACTFPYQTDPKSTPTIPSFPSPTLVTPTQSPTPFPSSTLEENQSELIPSPTHIENTFSCEGLLSFRLLYPPEKTKDLFEHHAIGTFLIFYLEIINQTTQDVQIFSKDYKLLIPQDNGTLELEPHKAATNYLYIVRGGSFYQDKIKPLTPWRTHLAFDIDPKITAWQLIISPGSGIGTPICENHIKP